MKLPLFLNKSEYDLLQNYLRLNIESIKFDNKKFLNIDRYQLLMILPGQKDPERIYSNMTYIECITFLDALKIAAKVVKQVKKENTDFISRHFEVMKG